MFDLPIINGLHPIQYLSPSVFYGHITSRRKPFLPDEDDELHDGYNIYVDAKNGNDGNSGLFENVPVKTMFRAGNVMKSLPIDREVKGVRIFLWGSTDGDLETYYREYLMPSHLVGRWKEAKTSPFVGMNNYMITANPRSTTLPLFEGTLLSPTDARRNIGTSLSPTPQPIKFFISGDNITMKKIKFTKSAGSTMVHNGKNGHFTELEAFDIYEDFISSSGSDVLIELCYFHHIDDIFANGLGGDAIHLSGGCLRPTVRYCVGHNSSAELYNLVNTVEGLFYFNDAFEAGWNTSFGTTRRSESVGVGFRLSSGPDETVPNTNSIAIANRAWRCADYGFQSTDDSSSIFLHNVSVENGIAGFFIRGDSKIILGNNIAYENGLYVSQSLSRPNYYPRHRYNTWTNAAGYGGGSSNLAMDLRSQPKNNWFKDANFPIPAPATGFSGLHFLPLESKFKNLSSSDYGFGKDVGPTDSMIAALKKMTPTQIRNQMKLFR